MIILHNKLNTSPKIDMNFLNWLFKLNKFYEVNQIEQIIIFFQY